MCQLKNLYQQYLKSFQRRFTCFTSEICINSTWKYFNATLPVSPQKSASTVLEIISTQLSLCRLRNLYQQYLKSFQRRFTCFTSEICINSTWSHFNATLPVSPQKSASTVLEIISMPLSPSPPRIPFSIIANFDTHIKKRRYKSHK